MRLHLLWVVIGLGASAVATEVCMRCRELEYLNGPGIGIDLTMGYGTAAIKFKNGTVYDVTKIDGSPEYLAAMRSMAVDALSRRAGIPSKWRQYAYSEPPDRGWSPPEQPLPTPSMLFASLLRKIQSRLPDIWPWNQQSKASQVPALVIPDPPNVDTPATDRWINAVSAMLAELRSAVHSVSPTITHNLVILSYPDFEADTQQIYMSSFQIACQRAGLEEFSGHSQIASASLVSYYKIPHCYDDDLTPSPYCDDSSGQKIDTALVVTYGQASFGTTLMTRWLYGSLYALRVGENPDHGAAAFLRLEDPDRYWEEIKTLVQEAVLDEHVDYLVLLGSDAEDERLRRVIREVCEEKGYGDTWRKHSRQTEAVGPGAELYLAARGAAKVARIGMVNGFDGCWVPQRCPKDDGGDMKSEL